MTITAQFRDGPLAGQCVEVDLDQHDRLERVKMLARTSINAEQTANVFRELRQMEIFA